MPSAGLEEIESAFWPPGCGIFLEPRTGWQQKPWENHGKPMGFGGGNVMKHDETSKHWIKLCLFLMKTG
jgi:hypothetical protein